MGHCFLLCLRYRGEMFPATYSSSDTVSGHIWREARHDSIDDIRCSGGSPAREFLARGWRCQLKL